MSYRFYVLAVFALVIGLSATLTATANPTCRCDEICSRIEQRCLNAGGTLDQCANAYDNCFLSCDTWPCASTCDDGACPDQLAPTPQRGENLLGLETPSWRNSESEFVHESDNGEEAIVDEETPQAASQHSD